MQPFMFLHLISDEKFIDGAIERFEKNDPGNHQFIFFYLKELPVFRHITMMARVRPVRLYSEEYDNLVSELSRYTAVFIHGLISRQFVEFVNIADSNVVFVWLFWGAELWSLKQFKTAAYLPLTQFLYYKHQFDSTVRKFRTIIYKYAHLFFTEGSQKTGHMIGEKLFQIPRAHYSGTCDSKTIKAIKRADYVIPVIKDDFDVLKQKLAVRAKLLDWNYSPGLPLQQLDILSIHGRDILVGNSAHYTNNHWDIFVKIKKHAHLFEKIIVPLSYGDLVYRDSVLKIGRRIWGDQFHPLLDFLPILEYFSLISNCYVAIFNTIRQQAMGNIIVSLYLGSKVFLRRRNPIYLYLKKQGAVVFSIENDLNTVILKDLLSAEERELNRNIVRNLYSEENLDKKTQQLINILKNIR